MHLKVGAVGRIGSRPPARGVGGVVGGVGGGVGGVGGGRVGCGAGPPQAGVRAPWHREVGRGWGWCVRGCLSCGIKVNFRNYVDGQKISETHF